MQCVFCFFFQTLSSSLWGNTCYFSTSLSLLHWSHGNSSNEKQPWKNKKDETWILTLLFIFFSDSMLYLFFNCWFTPSPASPLHPVASHLMFDSAIPFAVFFQCMLVFVVKISSCSEMKNDPASPKWAVNSSNLSLRNFRQMCHFASETLERAFKAILEKCENKSKRECHKREKFA